MMKTTWCVLLALIVWCGTVGIERLAVGAEATLATKGGQSMKVETSSFGEVDGKPVTLYSCNNANGVVLKMIDFGAIVLELHVPDRDGKLDNVNIGFDKLDGYLGQHPFFGSTVGRYCNRIAKGKFTLDGKTYQLATNNGENHLHGGNVGFNRVLWMSETIEGKDEVGVRFTYNSPDMDEGYPGNLTAVAEYTINNNNELKMVFKAETDKATPVNLTNHNYWNLAGSDSRSILDHELTLFADKYLPVDDGLIPTGELADVKGTPMDFTAAKKIGRDIKQIKADPVGYDHCYVLRESREPLRLVARLKDASTGRVMEIRTSQPAVQFYSGNFLDGSESADGLPQYAALCLETQHYPDSPNQPAFPNTILHPGEKYEQTTVHKFWAE
ncbi:MAG: aldose epimerase family protein [Pirellulaceae bacterium]|nr:galactose mutarotase [Planctomycetales bacterium]